jgi:hypothetical protein
MINVIHKKTRHKGGFFYVWWAVGDYSGYPCPHPFGAALRAFKIAPGDFIERGGVLIRPRSTIHKKTRHKGGFFYVWWAVGDSNARPID